MLKKLLIMTGAFFLFVAADDSGCGSDGDSNTGDGDGTVNCEEQDNSEVFPSCWNDLWADCFDPSGSCTTNAATQDTEWENGAMVNVEIDTANIDINNPTAAGAIATYMASDGTTCAMINTTTNADATVSADVTNSRTNAMFSYTIDADGKWSITCDGETTEVTAGQSACSASGTEACEVTGLDNLPGA